MRLEVAALALIAQVAQELQVLLRAAATERHWDDVIELFPHTLTYFSPNPLQLAPVAKGAVLMDQGLNRYSSAERFFEP